MSGFTVLLVVFHPLHRNSHHINNHDLPDESPYPNEVRMLNQSSNICRIRSVPCILDSSCSNAFPVVWVGVFFVHDVLVLVMSGEVASI